MSLLPLIFDGFCTTRPSRLQDQHFGMGLHEDDLLIPFTIPQELNSLIRFPTVGYGQPWRSGKVPNSAGSTISMNEEKFQVNLDVQHFSPKEIMVRVTGDNEVIVEAKHEEKADEHGYVSRQFVRKYLLPEDYDIQNIQSQLSSDGVLTITAPKTETNAIENRRIPIHQTGAPLKVTEGGKTDKKEEINQLN